MITKKLKGIDVTGQRFGRWFVMRRAASIKRAKGKGAYAAFYCKCDCGKEKIVSGQHLRIGASKSCGCWNDECVRGEHHPMWRGGKIKTNRGYYIIHRPEYLGKKYKNTYVLEHVFIMSEHLGRPLFEGETVHHKNGIRTDNRLENLELWSTNHPPGQRVFDLVEWAKQLLALYEPSSLHTKANT